MPPHVTDGLAQAEGAKQSCHRPRRVGGASAPEAVSPGQGGQTPGNLNFSSLF